MELYGIEELLPFPRKVHPKGGCRADPHINVFEGASSGLCQMDESFPDGTEGILGEVDEGRTRLTDGEMPEGRRIAANSTGKLETGPGLAGFGDSADEADTGFCPQCLDQPALRLGNILELMGMENGKDVRSLSML